MNTVLIHLRALLNLLPIDWVYVMSDLKVRPTGAVGKVGITGKTAGFRRADVEQSVRETTGREVRVSLLLAMPFPGGTALATERAIHGAFPFRFKGYEGSSGGTEWLRWPNLFTGLMAFLCGWGNGLDAEWCLFYALVFVALPVAIDLMLVVFLMGLLQWAVVFLLFDLAGDAFFAGAGWFWRLFF